MQNYVLLQARHGDLEELYAFSSERKMASVLLREPGSLLLYNKARRARVTIPSPCMRAPLICVDTMAVSGMPAACHAIVLTQSCMSCKPWPGLRWRAVPCRT